MLGDDVIIRDDAVAKTTIMSQLGVSINLSNFVISKDFAEFAKV